jgi:phage shock protein A
MQKDLEAQRTAVEQKYEKQSEDVEKMSGQIKSLKQACQDLDKDFRERTKALEAEQVLAGVPRALPP